MKTYELLVLIASEPNAAAELPPAVSSINELLGKLGGTITNQEDWGMRRLSFPIKKKNDGRYVMFTVSLPEPAVEKVDRTLPLVSGVLRHQLVVYKNIPQPRSRPTQTAAATEQRTTAPTMIPSAVETTPTKAPNPSSVPMTSEELDKTIDQILEEKIV